MAEQALRILFVEDNPADARMTQELLDEAAPGEFELSSVSRLSEALELLTKTAFDAVLLDLGLPDSHDIETFRRFHTRAEQVPTVVLTGLDNGAMGMAALGEGAQDYLVKGQLTGHELARSIRYAVARARTQAEAIERLERAERGLVLGLLGAKGGVGTTSLAIELAAALAAKEKSTIIAEIGACPATMSAQFGVSPMRDMGNLAQEGEERITKREVTAALAKLPFGARVLYGPQRQPQCADVPPRLAEAAVEELAELARFVIVDLGCRANDLVRAVVSHCDRAVVVFEPSPIAVKIAKQTVELLRSWEVEDERIAAVIVNRAPSLIGTSIAECRERLECPIIGLIPADSDSFHASECRGVPVVIDQPESLAAKAIREMAWRLTSDKLAPI